MMMMMMMMMIMMMMMMIVGRPLGVMFALKVRDLEVLRLQSPLSTVSGQYCVLSCCFAVVTLQCMYVLACLRPIVACLTGPVMRIQNDGNDVWFIAIFLTKVVRDSSRSRTLPVLIKSRPRHRIINARPIKKKCN